MAQPDLPPQNVRDIRLFVDRYETFTNAIERVRVGDFIASFGRISAALSSIWMLIAELEKRDAYRFNIFRLLGVERREVRTHSAMIADLLDPLGTHGQGRLFLDAFLRHPIGFEERDIRVGQWQVESEKPTWFGRLDVFVGAANIRRCVILENKVDASDQEGQLARYYRWLVSSTYHDHCSVILYLTPGGQPPTDLAFKMGGHVDHSARSVIRCISYKEHICDWLERCLREVYAQRVRDILSQYLEIVSRFKEYPDAI